MTEPSSSRRYQAVALSEESTVVAEYVRPPKVRETAYQSEAQLEQSFIQQLQRQAYEYLPIHNEKALIDNLKKQLEALNNITFSEAEWTRFFQEHLAAANQGIVEKTRHIQEDSIKTMVRDDGSIKNIALIDKKNIHNNRLQVINQYVEKGEQGNRYDVTILVNGLPMVHVELKRRGIDLREAFHQITRYQRESFWAECGLFEYVQLFVISNGTLTKYYSNTVRRTFLSEKEGKQTRQKEGKSFAFTHWWADAKNQLITDLEDFAKTFFAKHTLLNILTRYCVFDTEEVLSVMRPYQIVATEMILQRIHTASHHHQAGSMDAGGYIWHTTGSGKTLTSFKTALLAQDLPYIDKVLFVVDRKDLDYQTMKEYDRFAKGAANSNGSTAVLTQQLGDINARIIVTTIQKLSRFIAKNKKHAVYDKQIVLIFDECHRSQFGEMHKAITQHFKHYYVFGFTGTPIFADNARTGMGAKPSTTAQTFGDQLHVYTIVDAINDKNVLPFRIDYINTIKTADNLPKNKVPGIDTEAALMAPQRIAKIVEYIRTHFDQKTRRNHSYVEDKKRLKGFNSLFAVASIEVAQLYYAEFARQQQDLPPAQRLKIGLIYSFTANKEEENGQLPEESFETDNLDKRAYHFLAAAIDDYNKLFGANYDIGKNFHNYYKDISEKLKKKEIDLVIVVNMFLTGFDAKTLNTLWLDKNLCAHGLIQAYSRTNRILNSVKTYGNIVSFRNLEKETNEALALFGNKDARGIVLLKPYAEYFAQYEEKVGQLLKNFAPEEAIFGEKAQKAFIKLFGEILRLKNILVAFDDFAAQDTLSERDFADYSGKYQDIRRDLMEKVDADKEPITDDLVFEIELIKQVEVNVDYILMMVEEYLKEKGNGKDKEIHATIVRAIHASPSLRNKDDLIRQFVDSVALGDKVDEAWSVFVARKKTEELDCIIREESLRAEKTHKFMDDALRDGRLPTIGMAISDILPAVSLFADDNLHLRKKQTVLARLQAFFERYVDIG